MFTPYRNRFTILCTLMISLLLVTNADPVFAADDLYVNATTGSNTVFGLPNDCTLAPVLGVPSPPCRTITHAVSQASNGDTIYAEGIFYEAFIVLNKNLTIEGATINANTLGHHIEVRSGKTVVLRDVILLDGFSATGGAIYNEGNLTLDDVWIFNNTADFGGGIYNDIEGDLTILSTRIEANVATSGDGGGIYNRGGIIANENSWLHQNEAKNFGGGIYNDEYGNISLANVTISGSVASSGGGIYNMMGSVFLNLSTIHYSTVDAAGGGLMNVQGDLTIFDSSIHDNSAEDGGAIFNTTDNDDYLFIHGSEFYDNVAGNYGGAIYDLSANQEWTISNTTFENNSAELRGGALFLFGESTLNIYGSNEEPSLFESNTAVTFGGAIYSEIDLIIHDTTMEDNVAWEGGAVYSSSNGNLTIYQSALVSNDANFRGGAIFDESTGTFTTVNTTYSGNTAFSFGGAIFYRGTTARIANVTIYGNEALTAGGIYNEATIHLYNSIITASSSQDCFIDGGGVFNGRRNLVDDHATGDCSGVSPAAVTNIDPTLSGYTAVHTINGLSNAFDNGYSNCPDPLNGLAPLTVDQQGYDRLGPNTPCDIGAYELH